MSDNSEVELAYQQLREAGEWAAEVGARRIKELEEALEEALEYFEDRYDVVDGSEGEQRPNKEMRIGRMIEDVLHKIRF